MREGALAPVDHLILGGAAEQCSSVHKSIQLLKSVAPTCQEVHSSDTADLPQKQDTHPEPVELPARVLAFRCTGSCRARWRMGSARSDARTSMLCLWTCADFVTIETTEVLSKHLLGRGRGGRFHQSEHLGVLILVGREGDLVVLVGSKHEVAHPRHHRLVRRVGALRLRREPRCLP